MLKYSLLGLALILGFLVVIIRRQPDEFHVSRSLTMNAPAATIFPHVNNQRRWADWSPWSKLDPDATVTFSGPDAGVGSAYEWDGNKNIGAGKSTITESTPNTRILFQLDFYRPFKGTNVVTFTFEPTGDATVVTWTMTGRNNFIAKAVSLVMNCDTMVGDMFVDGLTRLKTIVETP